MYNRARVHGEPIEEIELQFLGTRSTWESSVNPTSPTDTRIISSSILSVRSFPIPLYIPARYCSRLGARSLDPPADRNCKFFIHRLPHTHVLLRPVVTFPSEKPVHLAAFASSSHLPNSIIPSSSVIVVQKNRSDGRVTIHHDYPRHGERNDRERRSILEKFHRLEIDTRSFPLRIDRSSSIEAGMDRRGWWYEGEGETPRRSWTWPRDRLLATTIVIAIMGLNVLNNVQPPPLSSEDRPNEIIGPLGFPPAWRRRARFPAAGQPIQESITSISLRQL